MKEAAGEDVSRTFPNPSEEESGKENGKMPPSNDDKGMTESEKQRRDEEPRPERDAQNFEVLGKNFIEPGLDIAPIEELLGDANTDNLI